MSLLTPDLGLLFWMTISFGIVFGLLAKFGFPVITRMVDERNAHIRRSLDAADEANRQLASIRQQSAAILKEAQDSRYEILKRAADSGARIVHEAREQAAAEMKKQLAEAAGRIEAEKQKALVDIRRQAAMLSVDIAEKILHRELERSDESRQALVEKLLEEVESETARN
ncbi:MAG: F0F1 ATP synthase subunit B [Tannerella sp.]|jgi:F-type H+-transporting ATPase subunit b|nr:F0F1 ATP synthase subunit B [Tannerella sp.]